MADPEGDKNKSAGKMSADESIIAFMEMVTAQKSTSSSAATEETRVFISAVKWLCGGGLVIIATCCIWIFTLGGEFEKIKTQFERSNQEIKLEVRLLKQQIDGNSEIINENKLSINRDILKQVNKLSSDVAVIKSELQKGK